MRKGFTLLELLVIIGILGVMTTVSVLSIFKGEDAARLRGTVRDVFATVRLARSTALVTLRPCIVTFATSETEDGSRSRIEIVSAEMLRSGRSVWARSLEGEWRLVGEGEPTVDSRQAFEVSNREDEENSAGADSGESVEDILFKPVADEVLKDICLKVVLDSDEEVELSGEVNEAKRSMISTFSNVDFLLGKYKEERSRERAAEDKQEAAAGESSQSAIRSSENEERSVSWQVNGRSDPHRIYVYPHGSNPEDGWVIRVDRFGSAKVFAPGEDAR